MFVWNDYDTVSVPWFASMIRANDWISADAHSSNDNIPVTKSLKKDIFVGCQVEKILVQQAQAHSNKTQFKWLFYGVIEPYL